MEENRYTALLQAEEAEERARRRVKEARYRRNAAAFLDFASNLIKQFGIRRGIPVPSRKPLEPAYDKVYKNMQAMFEKTFGDYKGNIASENIFSHLKANRAAVRAGSQWPSKGLSAVVASETPKLLSGSFENAIKDYKSSAIKNKSNYVSRKF